jgi:glycosyltransferase involved in cell wall biosynthesis
MTSIIQERFKQLKVCVLVPTYNNAGTLGTVLTDILHYTDQVIVVNDGSTDRTVDILKAFPQIRTISYSTNRGKGWALRRGFKKALEQRFDYAVTIDSDGQHFAEDLPKFLIKLEQTPNCLIIGARNMGQAGIPVKSSFGNTFSNFWYRLETGYKMEDTQCGYRLYPLRALQKMRFFTRRFEFEIEVIVRAAWKGTPIAAVPVRIFYEEKAKRISHFRPFRDFARISILNTVFVLITLLYIKPRDFFRNLFRKNFVKRLRTHLFRPTESDLIKAISVGMGVFMGIAPIWGFQLLTAIALAILFRLNKALVIIAASISIPPLIPIILYLSHAAGKLWMGNDAVGLSFNKSITLRDLQSSFTQYVLGAVTLASMAGLFVGFITFLLLKVLKRTDNLT